MIESEDIKKLSKLARIDLTEEEIELYKKEISSILGFVENVQKAVSGDDAPADRQAGSNKNVMRDDANPHESGLHTEGLLSEAPSREGNYVKVKKIL